MESKIIAFIREHHLLTLATSGERLWCCSMFYAFDAETVSFIVASDEESEHMRNIRFNTHVAGTVALETKIVGKIQGIQYSGVIQSCPEPLRGLYFEAFPYARIMNPTLWQIRIDEIKMTDNTLGFGKKIMWKR